MPRGRGKAPPAPAVTEETLAADFGRRLFSLCASSDSPSVFDLELRHYGDYLHHFGFSVEVERAAPSRPLPGGLSLPPVPPVPPAGSAAAPGAPGGPGVTGAPGVTGVTGVTGGPAVSFPAASGAEGDGGDGVARAAAFGISAPERDEADRWAASVGPLPNESDAAAIAARLAEPFARTMWRQSETQCAMKKARAVYRWMCAHIAVEPLSKAPNLSTAPDLRRGTNNANAQTAASAGAQKNAGRMSSVAAPTASEAAAAALQKRAANAIGVAGLYCELLRHAGVTAVVVEGHVRGRGAEEMTEWAWNEICIPCEGGEARLLVDVALSVYRGPLRVGQRPGEDANPNPSANTNANAQTNASTNASAKGRRTAGLGTAAEAPSRRGLFDGPFFAPMQSAASGVVEDFYFATHPCQFAATHFPRDARHTLLLTPPRRNAWEQAPCLSHTFFRFPVSLVSHRRRCAFTVRSTPFHVTVANALPDRVELCAVLFPGSLAEVPEDIAAASPLGPEWIWQQREEATACETFTLMVPAAGYYSLFLGARYIRRDPFSAIVAGKGEGEEEPFVPIVAYQVLVTFVPVQVPQIPWQHKSPSICKLITPLSYQVLEGSTRFTIMPSCANVAAVAIVARRTADGTREMLTFLPFSLQKVAYDGMVEVCAGNEVEIWIRYAAPDHNYVNSTELSLAQSPSPNAAALTSAADKPRGAAPMSRAETSNGPTANFAASDSAAMFFTPFVTRIEVRKASVASKALQHIAPQLTLEKEQLPTLRRLIGVTPELYEEAKAVAERRATQVGSYFAKKKPTRGSINAPETDSHSRSVGMGG